MNLTQIIAPECLEQAKELQARKTREKTPSVYELRIIAKDGRKLTIEVNSRLTYQDGNPTGIQGIARDITERKRAEEALQESETRNRLMVETLPLIIYSVDAEFPYSPIYVSANILALGHTVDEWYNAPDLWVSLLHPEDRERVLHETGTAMAAGTATESEYRVVAKDGSVVWLHDRGRVVADSNGKRVWQGLMLDITEQKQIEDDLHQARDLALESVRLKSEFLANMSHEIRTPMNGVIGMTGILLDTNLNEEQRDCAEIIRASGEALLTIINDILDFSKIEAGKLHFEMLDFDLSNAVEGTVELLAPRAHAKHIELASLIYSDVPNGLLGDPGRLRQVLTNLIGNAIKFTERGEVIVRAEKERETDNQIVIRFSVSDTGIGISEAAQKNLFQAFTQADGSTTRKYGGTGLGLAISKQLVELMGGELGVTSTEGKGSTFWFTARFAKQPTPVVSSKPDLPAPRNSKLVTEHTLPEANPVSNKLILLAEDNIVNQKVAARQLQKLGYRADVVANGHEALEALGRIPYDLLLMDCQMPEMDGYEATAAIRRLEGKTKHTPIVAMTAHALAGDRAKCLAAGMDEYITKPVKQEELKRVLELLLNNASGGCLNGAGDDALPLVDVERMHEMMGEEAAEFSEILSLYLDEMRKNLGLLDDAVAAGDRREVELIAHNCAGTSANCGMTAVSIPFRELEEAGRTDHLKGAPAALAQAHKLFAQTRDFLAQHYPQTASSPGLRL
jgi:PAS domain S-box-containing protein